MTDSVTAGATPAAPSPATETFEVYLYNVPKVTPDAKSVIPVAAAKAPQSGLTLDAARTLAADSRTTADRVVVIRRSEKDGKVEQALVERYRDGVHESAQQIVRH